MRPELEAFIEMRLEDGPVKGIDMALEVAKAHMDGVTADDIVKALEKLVREGKVVEVEYILPSMEYRAKSIYFPKGTEVRIPWA